MYNYLSTDMKMNDVCKAMLYLLESSNKSLFVFCISGALMFQFNYNNYINIPVIYTILNINIVLLVLMCILSLRIKTYVSESYYAFLNYKNICSSEFNKRIETIHTLGLYVLVVLNALSITAVVIITHNLVFNIL